MQKITPDCYISLHKKICNPLMIHTINRLVDEWGLSAQEVCYRLINEGVMRENAHRKEMENTNKLHGQA